jgi:hypothetical protein
MYEKQIARAIAVVALALVPLAAVADAPSAATPLKIERLTAQQLNSMPGPTVLILQTGRKVSLQTLRGEHTARLARFANAGALALQLRGKMGSSSAPGYVMVPMKLDPHGAADYQAFCGTVIASGCLYFPGPTGYFSHLPGQDQNLLFDYDPLITDPGVCKSQGGIIQTSNSPAGCAYGYPYTYTSQFNPGPVKPGQQIGSFIKSTQTCTPPVTVIVDHKGAIVMQGNFAASNFNVVTPSTLTCVVRVSVPPLS